MATVAKLPPLVASMLGGVMECSMVVSSTFVYLHVQREEAWVASC